MRLFVIAADTKLWRRVRFRFRIYRHKYVGRSEGIIDSFLQFNVSGVVASFNSAFGAGNGRLAA